MSTKHKFTTLRKALMREHKLKKKKTSVWVYYVGALREIDQEYFKNIFRFNIYGLLK